MSSSFLTVDLGNTRCKLRIWGEGGAEPLAAVDFATEAGLAARVAGWLTAERVSPLAAGALSAVAALEIEAELAVVLARALGGRFIRDLDAGLEIACREPATVGRDRLFAARGALARVRGSALVVGAGTALTVDALRVDEALRAGDAGSGRATFLGGAIAPGPALLARALADGGARLLAIDPAPGVHALGRDTREALQAGVVVGFRGAARELVERVGCEARLDAAPIVLSGGARAFLLDPPVFGARQLIEDAELVHRGMLAALADARPR